MTKTELERLYLDQKLTIQQIVNLKKISYRKVRYLLLTYNIQIRKHSYNYKDITNQIFGRLLAVKRVKNSPLRGSAYWLCRCTCGNETIVEGTALRYGSIKSCGCYKYDKIYKGYKDISKTYWGTIIKGAEKRKLKINISMQDAWELWEKQKGLCALTGQKLILNKHYSKEQTASLDRINNKQGYIKNNIRWVHKDINLLRNNRTDEQLISLCKQIVSYNERGKNDN